MKALLFAALAVSPLLALPAQAKLVTGEPQQVIAISAEDTAIMTGPAGAMIESQYFNAPQAQIGRNNSCRLPLSLFEKTRLARACN